MQCCAGGMQVPPMLSADHTLQFDLNTRFLDMDACMLVPASAASMLVESATLRICHQQSLHVLPQCRQRRVVQYTVLQHPRECGAVLHRHASMAAGARTCRHEFGLSSLLVPRCSAMLLSPATTVRHCS